MYTYLSDFTTVIESIEFGANMRVFSGFNSFYRALRENQIISQMKEFLADNPKESELLLLRLKTLLEQNEEPNYIHPHDIAIASYLYAQSSSPRLGSISAEQISAIPNLVWAKRLAEIVLAEQTTTIEINMEVAQANKYSFSEIPNYRIVNRMHVSINSNLPQAASTSIETTRPYRSSPSTKKNLIRAQMYKEGTNLNGTHLVSSLSTTNN